MAHMPDLQVMWRFAVIVERLIEQLSDSHLRGRRGGYVTFRDEETGIEIFKVHVGEQPVDKQSASFEFSSEKTWRLWRRQRDLLSHQSRNFEKKQLGGGVRLPNGYLVSISGLHEEHDTMVCLAVAYALDIIDDDELKHLVDIMLDLVGEENFPICDVCDHACANLLAA